MIECIKFTPYDSKYLEGFADIFVPKWGVEIKGCGVFRKDSSYWMNFPSREFETESGEKAFAPIVRFREKPHMEHFSREAMKAIEKFRRESQVKVSKQEEQVPPEDEDLPF